MKKNLVFLFVLIIFLGSCTKKEDYGTINVTVLDALNSPISGKYVYMFDSEAEMNKHLTSLTGVDKYSKVTDSDGVAYFKDVKIGDYWICCSFENLAGGSTDITGTATVTSEKNTEVTIKP